MSKLRKTILIIGILVVAVAASLGTALALYATGSMKTEPIELVYALKEKEKVYDGTPLALDDPLNDVSLQKGKLAEGHVARYEFIGSQTNVGSTMSDMTVKIYDKDGFNVTNDYTIKVQGAPLTVTQKSISVDMPSQKVVYNGSKVLFNEYYITENDEGELAELCTGHRIYGSTEAGLMNVGDKLPENLTPLVFDVVGNDVTANYHITFTKGEIEVIPRPVSVRPVSYEKTYDARELTAQDIEFLAGSLVEGQIAEYEINEFYNNTITNVGTLETQVTAIKIYDLSGGEKVDVTKNYEIDTYETGTLTVTPRPLTLTAHSAEFIYNGEAQSLEDETRPLSAEGLAEGERIVSITYRGSRTDVGRTENAFDTVTFSNKAQNYSISYVNGTIEILPYALEIQTPSAEKYYDGDELSDGNIDVELANINHNLVLGGIGELPSITDAGEVLNKFAVKVHDKRAVNAGDENVKLDVTGNYAITYSYGTLAVKQVNVKVTLNDAEHVTYDGEPHTPALDNSEYFSVAPVQEVGKFALDYTCFEVESDVKEMRNAAVYRYKVRFNDKKYAVNYILEVPENGYLTVDPMAIEYTSGTTSRKYTGAKLEDRSYTLSVDLPEGHSVEGPNTYPSVTKVGEIINEYAIKITGASGGDATANFAIKYNYGTLTVEELPIKVKLKQYTDNSAFVYSGNAVTLSVYEAIEQISTTESGVTVSEVIDKDDFSVILQSDIIDAGNDYSYTVKITDKEFAKNFALTVEGADGKVEVKALPVTVTLNDVDRIYNDKTQNVDAYSAINSIAVNRDGGIALPDGIKIGLTRDSFEVEYEDPAAARVDVDDYDFTVKIIGAQSKNYDLTVKNVEDGGRNYATLKIQPFTVDVTTATQEFEYNGERQRNGGFKYGALAGAQHTMTLLTANSSLPWVRDVKDVAENVFDVEITNQWGEPVTDNYSIRYDYGTLTVKKRPITVTTGDETKVFDGQDITVPAPKTVTGLVPGHELVIIADNMPEVYTVGEYKNTASYNVLNGGTAVTDNYLFTYVYGTLTITPCPVKVITDGETFTYDGQPHDKGTFTTAGFVGNVTLNYKVEREAGAALTTITDVGSVDNVFKCAVVDGVGNDASKNFEISYEYGKLKVTPLGVSLTLNDFSDRTRYNMVYNGAAKTFTVEEAVTDISAGGKHYTFADAAEIGLSADLFEIVYSAVIMDAGSYTYSVKFVNDVVAKNYSLSQSKPTVTVTKLQIAVTLNDYTEGDSLIYDGSVQALSPDQAIVLIEDSDGAVDENLLKKTDFVLEYSAELRAAGTYSYTAKIAYDYKAKNFNFAEPRGTVTIDALAVSVTLADVEFDYSGEERVLYAADLITVDGTELLTPADFTLKISGGKRLINAGDYEYAAAVTDKVYGANFDITVTNPAETGTVKINQLGVDVTLNPLSYTFNNSVITINPADALNIGNNGLSVSDFTLGVTKDGAAAQVYHSGNYEYSATLNNGNYKFNGTEARTLTGTVTVAKLDINVILKNVTKQYDGTEYELQPDTAINSVSGNVFGKYDFTVAYNDSLTDHSTFGTYQIKVELSAAHNAVKDDVTVTPANGVITINKRAITLTTATKSFEYDGKPHSATAIDAVGLAYGHTARALEAGVKTVTDVAEGEVENSLTYEIVDAGGNDVKGNYDVRETYGKISVTRRKLIITLAGASKPYDGTPLTSATRTADGLVEGHTLSAIGALPEITEVGTLKNEYECAVLSGVNEVTDNYTVSYVCGDLEITKVDVLVTLKTEVKRTYEGKDITLTGGDVIEQIDGAPLADTDFAVVLYDAFNAGRYDFTLELKAEENDSRYNVKYVGPKVLVIERFELTVNLADVTDAVYSGKAQKATAANVLSITENPDDIDQTQLTFEYGEEMLGVGEYKYGAHFTDSDLNDNYKLKVTGGNYKIIPAVVNVTLRDYEETYDNRNFTIAVNEAIKTIEGSGAAFIRRSDFAIVYNDSLRLARDTAYTYGVELTDMNKADNVVVNITEGGAFKINKRKLVIKLNDLEMSASDFEGFYNSDYGAVFDVTKCVTLESSLASGDIFRVNRAEARGDGYGLIELFTIADYELTNEDCYDFVNLDGETTITAQLKIG